MEFLDIINEENEAVSKATRSDVYSQKLMHRIAHVWLFNDKGDLALQMQSATKKFKPLHWCSTAAGHVQSGESLLEAENRELLEECEIKTSLKLTKSIWYEGKHDPGLRKIIGLCEGIYTDKLIVKNIEVDKVEFFSIEQIKDMINKGEPMHPELVFLFNKNF